MREPLQTRVLGKLGLYHTKPIPGVLSVSDPATLPLKRGESTTTNMSPGCDGQYEFKSFLLHRVFLFHRPTRI